ncbi:MAG: ABC transporter permease subunit, partial [Gemmatimonadetes bacterium]|nr:ABC transporter permease subunit [Gemmatimonadota bacterium]
MNTYLARIWLALWRLFPANPILVRVLNASSGQARHLWIRFAYLAVLLMVVLLALLGGGTGAAGSSLADLAKTASTTFMYASITQLALMCFLAPVFTAGAITQERDAQTFNILIATPLSNAQIVLGSLMSRLYFVLMLLLGGLPIFLAMMIYGGVTLQQITESFEIAGATAVLTGSLAICIAMIRVGTRRTIFSFYLMIGLYLLGVYALGQWNRTWLEESPPNVHEVQLSWFAAFHPFLSLDVALNRVQAPDISLLSGHGTFARYILAYPNRAYVGGALILSALLTIVAVFFVRRPKEEGSGVLYGVGVWLRNRLFGERRRKPRRVWNNPVAWREATTRSLLATRGLLRYMLLGGGLLTAVILLIQHIRSGDVAGARVTLSSVLMIELGLILLIATNTAATVMTKERESRTMDLLLCTPLTSQYIVWGKLRGLVTFTMPLIAIPTVTVLVFGVHGLFSGAAEPVVPIETAFEIGALLLVYSAAVCMLGMHTSLHSKRTIQSIMFSVGVVIVVCLIVTFVATKITESANRLGAAIAPLTPFTAV